MKAIVNNKNIILEYESIASQYDNGTDYIEFSIVKSSISEDLTNMTPLILFQNSIGVSLQPVTKTETTDIITLRWNINREITQTPGQVSFMIIFAECDDYRNYLSSNRIWSTNKITKYINESLLG